MKKTVYEVTYDLLRKLELTTVFGNPGSTEQPFLKNFPADFQYVLGLQESSVVAMADGFAQSTKKPVLLSLHTSAGTGHGMGNIMTAFMNKTPMIIMAGQQTREMILGEPMLTNRDETLLPRPWVKWAYQPARAQDVPAAIMRAYVTALMPPAGPVYLSVPLDDWDQPALEDEAIVRTASSRIAPDPDRLKEFAARINRSKNPVLIYGQDVEKSGGWSAGVEFAEKLNAPVFLSPLAERMSFPMNHSLFRGALPMAIGPLSERLSGFDLAIVIGAQVFRYYPYVAGSFLPKGTELLQITSDPNEAATAVVGDSLLGDSKITLEKLMGLVEKHSPRKEAAPPERPAFKKSGPGETLFSNEVFSVLAEVKPEHAILVAESPSNTTELLGICPVVQPESYYAFASGGLGWGGPASVGIALAQKKTGKNRPVIAVIGDGSLHYCVQSLYTASQLKLPVVYVVPCNGEYAILKDFAVLEKTPNVPALDLPGLNIPVTARGLGCNTIEAKTKADLKEALLSAMKFTQGPTVITVAIQPEKRALA